MSEWDPHLRLLTIAEAADSIDRPESTIRRWISEGRLEPAATNGRTRYYFESDILTVEAACRSRMSHQRERIGMKNPRKAVTSGGLTD
jgi:excisionase family DNA binding protein